MHEQWRAGESRQETITRLRGLAGTETVTVQYWGGTNIQTDIAVHGTDPK